MTDIVGTPIPLALQNGGQVITTVSSRNGPRNKRSWWYSVVGRKSSHEEGRRLEVAVGPHAPSAPSLSQKFGSQIGNPILDSHHRLGIEMTGHPRLHNLLMNCRVQLCSGMSNRTNSSGPSQRLHVGKNRAFQAPFSRDNERWGLVK